MSRLSNKTAHLMGALLIICLACNRDPEIRKLLGFPDDHEVYASITIGYAKYQFKRIPPRELAEVRYLK